MRFYVCVHPSVSCSTCATCNSLYGRRNKFETFQSLRSKPITCSHSCANTYQRSPFAHMGMSCTGLLDIQFDLSNKFLLLFFIFSHSDEWIYVISAWAAEPNGEERKKSQVNWKHFRVRRSGRQTDSLCVCAPWDSILKTKRKSFFLSDERKIERKSRFEWIFHWDDRRSFFFLLCLALPLI